MIRHIASIAEVVDDVDAARAYYRDVLGLEVEEGEDYAVIKIPVVLHFAVWSRAHAAEFTFGSREDADRVPFGFTLEFEVDDSEVAAEKISGAGRQIAQGPRTESRGQKTCCMISPGGGLLGFAETPWARRIKQQLEAEKSDA